MGYAIKLGNTVKYEPEFKNISRILGGSGDRVFLYPSITTKKVILRAKPNYINYPAYIYWSGGSATVATSENTDTTYTAPSPITSVVFYTTDATGYITKCWFEE